MTWVFVIAVVGMLVVLMLKIFGMSTWPWWLIVIPLWVWAAIIFIALAGVAVSLWPHRPRR